ncbi:MAG: MoaD/ThiS family protein [Acidobacteria bacterium]|nr:MoaD/ThiS family protein [Acidobacteriota bacterium]
MVTFNIAGFLADFTNGRGEISVDSSPTTVMHVNIFVDGENIRRKQLLDTPISGRTEITILPSVSGGSIS